MAWQAGLRTGDFLIEVRAAPFPGDPSAEFGFLKESAGFDVGETSSMSSLVPSLPVTKPRLFTDPVRSSGLEKQREAWLKLKLTGQTFKCFLFSSNFI